MSGAAEVDAVHRVRVVLVGPSLDIIGGQSVQLDRLRRQLRTIPSLEVGFIPVNPRLLGPLRYLQRVKYVRTVVTSIAYVASLVRLSRYDVVHAFSASYWSFLLAPVPAMLAGRLFGKGVILNYHSGEAPDHLATWPMSRGLMRLAHRIVVPSEFLVSVFGGHGLAAVAVANFLEDDSVRFRERRGARPIFLSNRNLEPLYNVECTLRAFAIIQHELPDARLIVAGDGSQRAALEALVDDLSLRNVEFTGRIPPSRMTELYAAADVYLNSPNIDNMPLSIIEAYAAGLPVATTDAGGIPFIVRHEETGLLVPVGAADELAAAALRIVGDPDLAARLSRSGRAEFAARYVWQSVCALWELIYRQAAGETPTGAPMPSGA
ncbi:MAG: glycosyltransferase family 4 protein [Gemmatimonadaceae bacterium]